MVGGYCDHGQFVDQSERQDGYGVQCVPFVGFFVLGSCGVRGEGPDDISFFNSRSWGLFGHGLFYADMNKCNLGAIRFEKGKPIFFVEKRITIPRPGAINGMAVSIDTSVMYFSSYCQENEFVRVNKEDLAHPVPIGVYPEYISGDIPAVNINVGLFETFVI